MTIDLNELKRTGKTHTSFFFEYESDIGLTLPNARLLSPVKVCGELFLTGENSATADGEVSFTVSGDCTRCLAPTEKVFNSEFSETFGNEDGYPVVNGKIDLKKAVDDVIIINTPVTFLCKDDCKGLCPDCGANLNDGVCKCNNK